MSGINLNRLVPTTVFSMFENYYLNLKYLIINLMIMPVVWQVYIMGYKLEFKVKSLHLIHSLFGTFTKFTLQKCCELSKCFLFF